MSQIHSKTLSDLEFHIILEKIAGYCISDKGKERTLQIIPFANFPDLKIALHQTNEYAKAHLSGNYIPNHQFDDLTQEIKLLQIDGSILTADSFLKIANASATVNELILFFNKFSSYFPELYQLTTNIEYTKNITEQIFKIVSNYGEVQNKASELLHSIRKFINETRAQIGESFARELVKYSKAGFLDDIRESIVENQPVLAVAAAHKKKVKGNVLGYSKTGSIVFIAPESTLNFHRKLQELLIEEKQEIKRILKILTNTLRPYFPLLESYLEFLIQLDVIKAKALYAKDIHGILPEFSKEKNVNYTNAYHPILLENNKTKGIQTIPQDLTLAKNQQIIVISGPNAGGKSITLKTIGLLQVMLQSGLLIPVKEGSTAHFFDHILTDIGDNQSIENQLSTYSYRLKNMRTFLNKCNNNTLFLIDEFGTGSDPELGGALAEIFLEEFHIKGAFGIITTHYTNLKVLADELPNVVNANMAFDTKTFEPMFKLLIGQPGSSFTFEVAQKNGIPFNLINRAKKKIDHTKIRFDKTISKLQQERSNLQKNSQNLALQNSLVREQVDDLAEKEQKIQDKLESFQTLYDQNQKMLYLGRKVNELFNKYFQTNNKKEFFTNFNKWLMIEKTNYHLAHPKVEKSKSEKIAEKTAQKTLQKKLIATEKEIISKVDEIRIVKEKQAKADAEKKARYVFKVNDKVRLLEGKACGIIEKIEGKKIVVNYGIFTAATTLDKIELVVSAKK